MRRDAEIHSITSAQPGPTAELLHRERQYLFMMGTRAVAIVVAVMVPGFWRWIAVAWGYAPLHRGGAGERGEGSRHARGSELLRPRSQDRDLGRPFER